MLYKKIFLFLIFAMISQKAFSNEKVSNYKSIIFFDYGGSALTQSDNLRLSTSSLQNIVLGTGIFTEILNRDFFVYSKAGLGAGQGSNQKDTLLRPYVVVGFDYYDNFATKFVYQNNILSRKHKFLVGGALGYHGIYNKYSATSAENIAISDKLYFNQVRINGGGLLLELNLGYEYAFYRNHNIGIKLSTQFGLFNSFDINTVQSTDGNDYQRYYNNVDSYISSTSIIISYKYFIETKL